MFEWGVQKYGANLHINEFPFDFGSDLPIFIDVETDEKDGFVGIGMAVSSKDIYYFNELSSVVKMALEGANLIGHNLKFDAKLLSKWGVDIKPEQLRDDTILMSYALNATKASHSLKELGKELGYEWPTYKGIVGVGAKKITLDKQPIELTANYCGMDVRVTYKLYECLTKKLDVFQKRVYSQIEMPLMRILYEMELQGVRIDVEKLKRLDIKFKSNLDALRNRLQSLAGKEINPNSNKQVAEVLTRSGIKLPKTPKGNLKVDKHVLTEIKNNPFVTTLLEHNKIEKLWSTYTQGMLERNTDTIKCTYNQITKELGSESERGISTGRLSSSDPNLQQIPSKTEEGKLLRELFIPSGTNILIDLDYSQIEYRLLAHFTKEPVLVNAFKEGKDMHEATAKVVLGKLEVTEEEREKFGKTINFAVVYGAMAKRIAKQIGCSEEEAQQVLNTYWSKLPYVTAWITRIKHQAKQQGGVYTYMKRWIPIPGLRDPDMWVRFSSERRAVNYVIQGSAAEVMKLAMIELRKKGLLPLLTVHDELLFECPANMRDVYEHTIKKTMESVVTLDVPLTADVGSGVNWREAKGG